MYIKYIDKLEWPPLAWYALCKRGKPEIVISVGYGVETTDSWGCEAAWDGLYSEGSFDVTDIVTGTGFRIRNRKMTFVSSCSTVDRLAVVKIGDTIHISNSLCCLLSQLQSRPSVTYPYYHSDFHSISSGIKNYKKQIPFSKCDVSLVYFNNIAWDGEILSEIEKPNRYRQFATFKDYYDFLSNSMQKISENARDSARNSPFSLLTTVSSGYDSTTVAALAIKAGCREAVSFKNSRSGDVDSGEEVAQHLGLKVELLSRDDYKKYNNSEVFLYSGEGEGEESFLGAATGRLSHKILLTGFHGDKVWDKDTKHLSDEIVRGDATGLSLTEWRLKEQFLHCPVPFWSCRSMKSISQISKHPEMSSWDLDNNYNRPICRRILETEGVPRKTFGMKKKATSHTFYESMTVLSKINTKDYNDWIKRNRWHWIKEAEFPPLVFSDRAVYYFYIGRLKLLIYAMRLVSTLPIVWRAQKMLVCLRHRWIIENCPPSKYRRCMAQWAIEKVMSYYP